LGLDDLKAAAGTQMRWLWHGYLAPGNITLLTSQWKSGKTTLIAVLLNKMKAGGQLAGLSVAAGKAVVLSEEGPTHWYLRSQKLAFGNHVCWFCRPFLGRPTPDQWLDLLDRIAQLHAEHGLDLLVIDPLASFLPGRDESNAGGMLEALMPLQRLTALGMSVLVAHHPRKKESADGHAARGSGALSGYVDIIVEMHWYSRASEGDRRRRLQTYSRYEATPRQLVIELNADGTDYSTHGGFHEDEFTQGWHVLRQVLEDAHGKLTRREILGDWPEDHVKPGEITLWKWLERAVAQALVLRSGTGRKSSPYRYWLPGMEEKWQDDPFYLPELPPWDDREGLDALLPRRRPRKKD